MKKYAIVCSFLIQASLFADSSSDMLSIQAAQTIEKMKLLIVFTHEPNVQQQQLLSIVQNDLALSYEKTTGFSVQIATKDLPKKKSEIKQLFDQGFPLALFITDLQANGFDYRIYDTGQAVMVAGKKVVLSEASPRIAAHHLAELIVADLLGQQVRFGTILAYCKELQDGKKKIKHIYGVDPHIPEKKQLLVEDASTKCGLRWHPDATIPRLYYSEHTPVNIRLLAYDLEKKAKKLVMNFDGLNMQPAFSNDGTEVIVCSSRAGSSQLYRGKLHGSSKQWKFKRITHNMSNNVSPHLCSNGDIVFCSDMQQFCPQIYYYSQETQEIEKLTSGGYSASPAVCEKIGMIAYIKIINRIAQVCTYNLTTKEHIQHTFDEGDKDEPTWSPCGNYLAYSVEKGAKCRIAVRNMKTAEDYFITAENEHCSCPAWSTGVIV